MGSGAGGGGSGLRSRSASLVIHCDDGDGCLVEVKTGA